METRKECYKCLFYKKCIPPVVYDSVYCKEHKKYEKQK